MVSGNRKRGGVGRKAFRGAGHRARAGRGGEGDGYLHGNGYVVTWAIGHLVALAQPHEIQPQWSAGAANAPHAAGQWPLVVYEKTKDQFERSSGS